MSSCGEVVASPPRRRGSQVRAPWYHGGHGAIDTVGLVAYPVARGAVGTQECTQIGENGLSESFRGICVHCCNVVDRRGDAGVYTDRRKRPLGVVSGHLCTLLHPRAVSGGTSASTAMMCRRRPLGGHLSLGWENGLCASTAAARLASSPRQQPTQTPEEPSFGHIRTPAASSDVPGPSRGPSGCPRRRRLTGPASTSARCIPGSVSAGQGCLPRLPAPVPGGSTRASRSAQGTTGSVWSRRPAHLVRLALPSHPARARLVCLPSARPSRPFHHGAEAALRLRVCHILPCFTLVRARGRRCACPGPHAREATPTHPSA